MSGTEPATEREAMPTTPDPIDAACRELARLSIVLATAIAKLDYSEAAWGRRELAAALTTAEAIAGAKSEPGETFVHLAELCATARLVIAVAPSPSEATLAATATGDMAAWNHEAQAWIAARSACAAPAIVALARRYHRDTRPESPRALRDSACGAATEDATRSAASSREPLGDEGGAR